MKLQEIKKLIEQAKSDPQFFHDLMFNTEKTIENLDYLDSASKGEIVTLDPETIVGVVLGDVAQCGISCGNSCGGTCEGSCNGTCATSCEGTCGADSCGTTSNKPGEINTNPGEVIIIPAGINVTPGGIKIKPAKVKIISVR